MIPREVNIVITLPCHHFFQSCMNEFFFSKFEKATPSWVWGMPCTQCARSAKFWMSANTRTLVSALFHKFLAPYQAFFF